MYPFQEGLNIPLETSQKLKIMSVILHTPITKVITNIVDKEYDYFIRLYETDYIEDVIDSLRKSRGSAT